MTISSTIDPSGILVTQMRGVVDQDAFMAYYLDLLRRDAYAPLRGELVDASTLEQWAVPVEAQWALATEGAEHLAQLAGIHVAMVAPTDHVFASFRMWELLREDLGYEVRAFRALAPARGWLAQPTP